VAQNTQANPVIAGFQIAAAGVMPRSSAQDPNLSHAVANSDPEDEDAAESRIDPDELPMTPAPQAHAPAPPPPPAPTRTAMLAPPPVRVIPVQGKEQTVKAADVNVPQPIARPQMPVMLAAYHPQAMLNAAAPKPRPVVDPSLGVARAAQTPQNIHNWTIQIGAFGDEISAKAQLSAYAERSMDVLGQASRIVIPFQGVDGHTLYRARFGPFEEREAREVCERLTERGQTCFAAVASR
jgi:D-alanyl-D-alanine carboxypeptidase